VVIVEWGDTHPAFPDLQDDAQLPPDTQELTAPEWLISSIPCLRRIKPDDVLTPCCSSSEDERQRRDASLDAQLRHPVTEKCAAALFV
jgi:hypothetical protein